jgi:thioredoxin 1
MIFRKRVKPINLEHLDDLEPLIESGQPILLDFWQLGCQPCRTMDGIINELAEEYAGGAHIVKVNVGQVHGAVQEFKIRSTPTFVLLGRSQKKPSKKARRRGVAEPRAGTMTPRWRASGLVNKAVITRVLESNGARRAE